jgi:hypothetical protein
VVVDVVVVEGASVVVLVVLGTGGIGVGGT